MTMEAFKKEISRLFGEDYRSVILEFAKGRMVISIGSRGHLKVFKNTFRGVGTWYEKDDINRNNGIVAKIERVKPELVESISPVESSKEFEISW